MDRISARYQFLGKVYKYKIGVNKSSRRDILRLLYKPLTVKLQTFPGWRAMVDICSRHVNPCLFKADSTTVNY